MQNVNSGMMNSHHNTHSNNKYDIKILNYNNTDYEHLTEKDYLNCLKDNNHCVKRLIEKVHFDKEKKENHNIYISNIKNNYVMVYSDGQWTLVDRTKQITDLYDKNEYDFENIVMLLKKNGITTIGADDQLTEKNIMKLTNLLSEQPSPDENNLLDILKQALERMEDPNYRGGIDGCPKADHFKEDIIDIIEDYEEESSQDAIAVGADDAKNFSIEEKRLLKIRAGIIK